MVGDISISRISLCDALSDLAVVLAERLVLGNVWVEVSHLKLFEIIIVIIIVIVLVIDSHLKMFVSKIVSRLKFLFLKLKFFKTSVNLCYTHKHNL
jgi:hypothetical protein